MNTSIGAVSWRERRPRFMSPPMSPAEGSRWADLLKKDNPAPGMERIVRKNGKRNSAHVGHGRAGRWMVLTARWSAALLCAYVPLANELPSLMPAPLLNVLALVAGLHAVLPLDGIPRTARARDAASPACRTDSVRRLRTADIAHPVRAVGTPWAVARHRDRRRLSGPSRRVHRVAGRMHRPGRPNRPLVRAPDCSGPPAAGGRTGSRGVRRISRVRPRRIVDQTALGCRGRRRRDPKASNCFRRSALPDVRRLKAWRL